MKYRLEISKPIKHKDRFYRSTLLLDDHHEHPIVALDMIDAMVNGLDAAGFQTELYRTNDTEEKVL